MSAHTATAPGRSARCWAYRSCLALALGLFLFGVVELVSWHFDRAHLRGVAVAVVGPARGDAERLTRLTAWVYRHQRFDKNRSYHLWRKLKATPRQVLEHGGDCADKSRLLAALLRELGIKSSLAMTFACEGCKPRHTVVLVETRTGWTLVDPVYDMTFPDGRSGFLTIEALRSERALLEQRLAELRTARGPADKINRYKRTDHYAHLSTINWNKNALTRGAAGMIRAAGAEPWAVPRPQFLEDPKQLFALLGFCGALGLSLPALLLRPRPSSTRAARPVGSSGTATDAAARSQPTAERAGR